MGPRGLTCSPLIHTAQAEFLVFYMALGHDYTAFAHKAHIATGAGPLVRLADGPDGRPMFQRLQQGELNDKGFIALRDAARRVKLRGEELTMHAVCAKPCMCSLGGGLHLTAWDG